MQSASLLLVGLSHFYSKKYESIREAKLKMGFSTSPNDSVPNPARTVNEYGETEVSQYIVPQHRVSDSEAAEMAGAYRSGKTTYELAEQYRCCRHAVVRALKKNDIKATKAKAQEVMDSTDVIKMYEEYHTTAEIAKKYGVHPNAVIRCLRSNGVTIRSRWDYPRIQ